MSATTSSTPRACGCTASLYSAAMISALPGPVETSRRQLTTVTWAEILLLAHVIRAQWIRSRYHLKVKILTACRLGPGLLKSGALYRAGTVDQPS